jgi:hypothetical protein
MGLERVERLRDAPPEWGRQLESLGLNPQELRTRLETDALLASRDSQNSRQPVGIGRQNPAAGNGIFGCRDGRLKIGLRDRKGHRRPKEWNDTGENPHRNGLSRAGAGVCGFLGLDGGVRSRIRTGLHCKFPCSQGI